jgi:hypothetical protein
LCDSRLFLATSLDPLLTRVAIHTHVVDDFKAKILDRGIEGKIKYIVWRNFMHPFGQLLCVSGRTLFWKKILVGDDNPPNKDLNWIACLNNSSLCPMRTLRTSFTKRRNFFF